MKSVFILYRNTLFARGLEKILRKEGVNVVGSAASGRQALERIHKLAPDVVIAEDDRKESGVQTLLEHLLRVHPRATVVRLSLADTSTTLYTGENWRATTAKELVEGIWRAEWNRKGPGKHASV